MAFEQVADQQSRALVQQNLIWFGEGLKARGEVWSLANNAVLLCITSSDHIADDNRASREAYSTLQDCICEWLERGHCRDQFQTDPHRALGIVLMSLRVSKIDEYSVAHISGHKPRVPGDHVGDAFVIRADYVPQILGIKLR